MKKHLLIFFVLFFVSSKVHAGQKSKEDARYDKACEALGYGMSDDEWEEALSAAEKQVGILRLNEKIISTTLIRIEENQFMPAFELDDLLMTLNRTQGIACKMKESFEPKRRTGSNSRMYEKKNMKSLLDDYVITDNELSDL